MTLIRPFAGQSGVSKQRNPPELVPLAEKAIKQGHAVRQGQPSTPFTAEELALIQTKYVHCSSHWNSVVIKDDHIQGGVNAIAFAIL
ncbi:hypothetical protein [Xenorhabdus siamensis]|uniref:hypothetical protein n=1 Tax=Xenorhabdus siamensis TaxID=3136254 RepID=UPI0030F45BB4